MHAYLQTLVDLAGIADNIEIGKDRIKAAVFDACVRAALVAHAIERGAHDVKMESIRPEFSFDFLRHVSG